MLTLYTSALTYTSIMLALCTSALTYTQVCWLIHKYADIHKYSCRFLKHVILNNAKPIPPSLDRGGGGALWYTIAICLYILCNYYFARAAFLAKKCDFALFWCFFFFAFSDLGNDIHWFVTSQIILSGNYTQLVSHNVSQGRGSLHTTQKSAKIWSSSCKLAQWKVYYCSTCSKKMRPA